LADIEAHVHRISAYFTVLFRGSDPYPRLTTPLGNALECETQFSAAAEQFSEQITRTSSSVYITCLKWGNRVAAQVRSTMEWWNKSLDRGKSRPIQRRCCQNSHHSGFPPCQNQQKPQKIRPYMKFALLAVVVAMCSLTACQTTKSAPAPKCTNDGKCVVKCHKH